MNRTLPPW